MTLRCPALQAHAIELDAATAPEWCQRIADDRQCAPEDLRVEFAAAPPFLEPGCLLLQLLHRTREPAPTGGWWFRSETEAVHDTVLWYLVGGAEPEERWIQRVDTAWGFQEALSQRPGFRIDAETAADYLRVFANFAETQSHILWPLESPGELFFWTPLNKWERKQLSEKLGSLTLSEPRPVTSGFEIEGAALRNDELWRVSFHLYDRDVFGLNPRTPIHRKGEILVSFEDDKPLVTGLPANYLPRSRFRPAPQLCGLDDLTSQEGRRRLGGQEAEAVIRDINHHVRPLIQPVYDDLERSLITRAYLTPLPFYGEPGLNLVELHDCRQSGERVTRFVVWRPGFAASLHTESGCIHDLNEHLEIHHHWSLRDERDAARYLEYFCSFTWGDHGPFQIISRPDQMPHPAADPSTAKVFPKNTHLLGADSTADAEELLRRLQPPRFQRRSDEGGRLLDAAVFYAGTLFYARFEVGPDGSVTMLEDTPLIVWELWEGTQWRPEEPAGAIAPPIDWEAEARLKPLAATDCIAEILRKGEGGQHTPVEIRNRVVSGRLNLRGESVGPLRFDHCRFRGPVDFGHLSASGYIELHHCVFENGLDLEEAELRGRLHLKEVVVCGGRSGGGLRLAETSVRNLLLDTVCLEGDIRAESVEVRGNLDLLSVQTLGGVDLEFCTVGQRLLISTSRSSDLPTCMHTDLVLNHSRAHSIDLQGLKVCGDLSAYQAFAEQAIDITGLGQRPAEFLGDVSLYGTVAEKNQLIFSGVTITGDLNLNFARVGTGLWIEPEEDSPLRNFVRGDLEMGGLRAPQLVRIRRTDIGGKLYARGLEAGEIRMAGDNVNVDEGNDTPRLEYRPLRVGGDINLEDADIANEVYLAGIASGGALRMRHARTGGDVALAIHAKLARERGLTYGSTADEGFLTADFPGGVNLSKTEIGGDVVLSAVQCQDGIDLSDSRVRRDIEIRAVDRPARARSLDLEGLHCEGNIDISGLRLAATCTEPDCRGHRCDRNECRTKRKAGHVVARHMRVAGRLRSASAGETAVVPGCLDLSFSALGTLEISVDTFPLRGREAHEEGARCGAGSDAEARLGAEVCGVVLRRASIDMLSVHANESGYPRPLDLRHAEIRWWEFNRRDVSTGESRRSEAAEDYIRLLTDQRNLPLLQRHTWRSIENNLFNWGHEVAADEVYRAMRRWLLRQPPSGPWERFKWPFRWAGDILTKGLTSPWRLLGIMGLWLLLSSWLFSLPGNIGPSEQGYFVRPAELRYVIKNPPAGEWGLGAGFWTALGFHVPVAAFTARDEWEPANDTSLAYYQKGGDIRRIGWPLSAEDYANLVLITHWIMWPVVIVLASRKLFRRAQQQ
ncbi:MAG: hypothetical protein Kow006_18570 [Gammaproteobacteria bacterium]